MASTVWRGYITFGLITIPVRLFRAARAERVSFRRLYQAEAPPEPEADADEERDVPVSRGSKPILSRSGGIEARSEEPSPAQPFLAPVQQVSVRKGMDEPLPEQSVVKGYEYEKNKFVVIEKEELKNLAPKTSAGMEIQEFVSLPDIDPVYFETSYYVTPEEAGQKAYALLYKAMQTTSLVAVAQFAMHSREHVVVLRPGRHGLLAHTMFYASEVRADEEYSADVKSVSDKELKLAETLIGSLTAPFEPEKYRDTYREQLESMIARKVKGQPVAPATAPPRSADVVDIAEALRRSLANLKKPAKSEGAELKPHTAAPKTRRAAKAAAK
ncbi:MAG TPA: Ku protein [Bryobacteraceae bacterium]|nr:Ku protein [Bryobacteraceae bacterium]